MELRSVEELMDLLYACRGVRDTRAPGGVPADLHVLGLRTAAVLRRSRPADKELQVTGLVRPIGQLLGPVAPAGHAADAVRGLLGGRVSGLVRRHPWHGPTADDDLLSLRHADEEGRTTSFDAGVLEDWRTVLELVAERHATLRTVD